MSVGIYDHDLMTYEVVPFNLQAMKLSAYYKNKREIVVLAKDFTPERNKQFFYVKDWDDGEYPDLLSANNVKYFGHAFSGPQYVPMSEDIELMKPDTYLYSSARRLILGKDEDVFRAKVFKQMTEAEHLRISLDGATVWKKYPSQLKNLDKATLLMFHDYDLGKIEGGFETVKSIVANCKQSKLQVGMKFPVVAATEQDILNWSSLPASPTFYSIRYNGIMSPNAFSKWMQAGQHKDVYAQLEYDVTAGSFSQNDFLKNRLREIFRQVIISRSYHLRISLYYGKDFFEDKRWERLLDLFNHFQHSLLETMTSSWFYKKIEYDTFYDFVKHIPKGAKYHNESYTREELRDLFMLVHDTDPELFKDFYELNFNALKEGLKYE